MINEMRSLILLAAVLAAALAKPGTYRESEDFQYERSATGEGSKSGFYGAQRGNVGGNYERAHNMDGLAQKQLSDAVRNVQGELGDTNHVGVGNVYTATKTRSSYGQHSNVGNLEGINYQEGSSSDSDSQSSGSQYSSHNAHSSSQKSNQFSSHNADYRKGYSSYQQNARTDEFGSDGQTAEASDRQQGSNYGGHVGESMAYTGSEYKGQGAYDYSHKRRSQSQREEQSAYGSNSETRFVDGAQRTENAYGSTAKTRLNGGGPNRISIRPGSSITVPVRVEQFDDSNRRFEANTINTDNEVLDKSGRGQQTNSKNYESSYRYHKAWEKQDKNPTAVPLGIPTTRPSPESYSLTGAHDTNAASSQYVGGAKTRYNGYNAASRTQSRYESGYNERDHQQSDGTHSNAYESSQNLLGSNDAVSNVDVGSQDSTPKKYQSKYSYHKSWERQGDPYIIVPVSGGGADGDSTFNSHKQGYRSQNYNSHASNAGYTKTGQVDEFNEADHSRVRRSNPVEKNQEVDPHHQHSHQYEGQQQQEQQQVDWSSEDLGQHIQTQHDFDKLETFSQQSEDKWGKPDKLQKPPSASQTQDSQQGKLEDLSQQQQMQTSWDNFGQQTENKWDNMENPGQQTQNLEDFGQKVENQWSNSENLGQQTQDLDNLGQQTVNLDTIRGTGQETQNGWHTIHTTSGNNQWKWRSNVDSDSQVRRNNYDGTNHEHDTLGTNTGSGSNKGVSLQSLWNKIDNMAQGTVISNSNQNQNISSDYHNHYSNGFSDGLQSSQNTQDGSNNQFSHGAGNYNYQQSSHSWQSHGGTTQKSYSHYETSDHHPWHSKGDQTTEKMNFNIRTSDEVKPSDAGRGDIGAEDSGTAAEPKKPLIFTSQSKPTKAKDMSTEELSLTEVKNNKKADGATDKDNIESLGVLSLEEQGKQGQSNLDQSRISTSNSHVSHNQRERTESSSHGHTSTNMFNNNQQDNRDLQTSWSQHGNSQWQEQNAGQQTQDFEQQVESDWTQLEVNDTQLGHQNAQQRRPQAGENLENLGQQIVTDWTKLEHQSQHRENTQQTSQSRESLADFGQHKETDWKPAETMGHQSRQTYPTGGYLHQQTHTTPKASTGKNLEDLGQQVQTGQNLEDLGQQVVQTDWSQDENLQQQSQLTQTSDLGTLTQQGNEDFYKQKYHEKPQERSQLNVEHEAVPAKVEEVTTPKPGFWKNVGTKVSGWFGKS